MQNFIRPISGRSLASSRLVLTLILLSFALPATAKQSKLKTLITKQDIKNLRFTNDDGSVTYYQRRSGNLVLSTNYKVHEVLKKPEKTQYLLTSSPAKKKVLITSDENYYQYFSMGNNLHIHVVDYGGYEPKEIGWGVNPALHVDDSWVSYYQPAIKTLFFSNLENNALNFEIKINGFLNPYFVPTVVMTNNENILYSDTTKDGEVAIFHINRKLTTNKLFVKTNSVESTLELCLHNDRVLVLNRGTNHSKNSSILTNYSQDNLDASKGDIIWESKLNEIGNLVCNHKSGKVYFVKNTSKIDGLYRSEAASLDLESKKVEILSDLEYVTNIINMDGRLMIHHRGDFYVLLGGTSLKTDSIAVQTTEGSGPGEENKPAEEEKKEEKPKEKPKGKKKKK